VCPTAVKPGSKNRRRNTGALISFSNDEAPDARPRVIAIDCGKFWWEAVMGICPQQGIRHIDAVLLTHDHHDAMGGMDDLRDFSMNLGSWDKPLKVFLNQTTYNRIKGAFPYLVDKSKVTGSGFVATLEFIVFENGVPFEVEGLKVTPFTLTHGSCRDFSAFRIGSLCWMSDVSQIPESSRQHIKGSSTIVLDYLEDSDSHPAHFVDKDVLKEVPTFRNGNTDPSVFLVGMSHLVDHDKANANFASKLPNVQLAWDGQSIEVDLQ